MEEAIQEIKQVELEVKEEVEVKLTQEEIKEIIKLLPKEFLDNVDKKLKLFAKLVRRKLRDNWDVVIGITGFPGTGKTTLAIILSYLIDENYTFEVNVCFIPKPQEIKKMYYNIKPCGAFHIDEASKALHKHKWWDATQQTLNILYDTEREFHYLATILVMPRFQNFTENFRNFRIKYWMNIMERGVGVCYIKDEDKDVLDPWHIDENYKRKIKRWTITRRRIFERTTEDILRLESKLPNYWFTFTFPDLPEEVKKKFSALKAESRKSLSDLEEKELGIKKETAWDIKKGDQLVMGWKYAKELNPLLSMAQYARKIGMEEETFRVTVKKRQHLLESQATTPKSL